MLATSEESPAPGSPNFVDQNGSFLDFLVTFMVIVCHSHHSHS